MPVNPGNGEQFAAQVARLVDATEEQLLRALATLLRQDPESPSWAIDRLRDVQRLVFQARQAGRTLTPQLQQAVRDAILDALNAGTATALNDLPDGTPAVTGRNVPLSEQLAAASIDKVISALDRMPSLLQAAYEEAVHAGAAQVLGGSQTRLQASQTVLDRLLGDGIRGYVDRAGRSWALDTYVEMSIRSVTGQAAVQAHIDQLRYGGRDLVIVSDAPHECPLCRPWEGKVLSIGGRVGAVIEPSRTGPGSVTVHVAGTVDEARAAGLQHPNCRHSLSSYVPGATKPAHPQQDSGKYDAVQRQRAMERNVRSWKRRQALALTDEQAAYAARKVRDWQRVLREHTDANELKRLRRREQVGSPAAPLAH